MNGTRYRVDPDLTKEQRAKLEALWEEAHQKTTPEVRFYVVGQENPVLRSRKLTEKEKKRDRNGSK